MFHLFHELDLLLSVSKVFSNTKMAAVQQNLSKMISAQLRNKANEFLNSRKNANNLADILQMFEVREIKNFSVTGVYMNYVLGYVSKYSSSYYRLKRKITPRCF